MFIRTEIFNSKFTLNSKYLFIWSDKEICYFDIDKPFIQGQLGFQ